MKSILLTGGAGFIGSHTCLALLEKGYSIAYVSEALHLKKSTVSTYKGLITRDNKLYKNMVKLYTPWSQKMQKSPI